jgi:hypothetical protein
MASHEEWILRLPHDLDSDRLRVPFHRFADSPGPSDDVFGETAVHPNAPPDVLRAPARRRAREIDLGLGLNPSTPADVLHVLARRRFDDGVEHVIGNPSAPARESQRIAERGRSTLLRARAAQALHQRRNPFHSAGSFRSR